MLGALDLDEFVDRHLVNLSDWERNFKALKARGRDAEKLPMEIKVSTSKVFLRGAKYEIIFELVAARFQKLKRRGNQLVISAIVFNIHRSIVSR